MKEKEKAKFVFLGREKKPVKRGKIGFVVLEFSDSKDSYLDLRVNNTSYYDTGHIGYIAKNGDFFVYAAGPLPQSYIGKTPDEKAKRRLSRYLVYQFNFKSIIKRQQYFLVDDNKLGFKHIYPYPGSRFLSEYYKKFTSSPQLRNFFFEYHTHVFMTAIGKDSGKGGKVLDVASGDGSFLATLKKHGFRVFGFEPSESECREAKKKGVNLINSTFAPELLPGTSTFDLVIAGNILEHVSNPYDFMRSIKRVLKKGGFLFFQIPNDFNMLQKTYLKNSKMPPWFVAPPEHLNYWDVAEARNFVKRCGFKIVHEEAQFPIEIFLLFGLDYRKNPELGKEAHRMRCNFEDSFRQDMDSLSSIYSTFIKSGIGRDYVAVLKSI